MSGVLIVNINRSPRMLKGCRAIKRALVALRPSLKVSIHHWERVSSALIARLRPGAVVIGPNETPFPAYPPAFDGFLSWLRARRAPTLGICGGHQALALAHGAPIGPVHDVPPARESYAGMPKVTGATAVRFLGDPDPLLTGVGDEVMVTASHVDEVKEIPAGFRLLAIGDPCHIQAIRADRRPIYGVQFHPERPAEADRGAGLKLLGNFLEIAKL